jgi:uncharacterized cupredoxin-like copper-binding protein
MMHRLERFGFLVTGTLLVGLLATTACSGATASGSASTASVATLTSEAQDGAQQVTLTVGNSMSFEPATIRVNAGQPVELILRNDGQMPHDFTLSNGVAQPVKVTANAGQTASATFALHQPGAYTFECSMPGHALAGMHGTITVQ